MRFSFYCTASEEHFALDHDIEPAELERLRGQIIRIPCPACHGAHAVLVGEHLMRAPSPGNALRELLGTEGR